MKKLLILPVLVTLFGSGSILALERQTTAVAEFDLAGLNQQVQNHDETLDNHEARLDNVEGDVTVLQSSTATPPSPNHVNVPAVTTPKAEPLPEPTPQPTPVVVVSFEQIPLTPGEDWDCKLVYSDATEKVWKWKVVTYNQGTQIIGTSGKCDNSLIGTVKP